MNIVMFMGGLQFDSQRKVVEGVWQAAKEEGNNVFLYVCDNTKNEKYNEGEFAILDLPDLRKYDGILLYAETIYSDEARRRLVDRIRHSHIPCVSIDYTYPDMLNVYSDNYTVMQEIVEHLIRVHGAKTINYIAGPLYSKDDSIRRAAYLEVMRKHGLEVLQERMYYGNYTAKSGQDAIQELEKRGYLQADAYVCANDQMALGAYAALTERGIRIPQDTLLTGFDNIFMARNHTPRITTAERNEREIGRKAYAMVTAFQRGESVPREMHVASRAIFGESCGCKEHRQDQGWSALNHFSKMHLRSARLANLLNNSAASITGVSSIGAFCGEVHRLIREIEPEEFYLCLSGTKDNFDFSERDEKGRQIEKTVTSYCDLNNVEVAYVNGQFKPCSVVNRKDIIPKEYTVGKRGNLYVVKPLHYLDRCYGYTVICNSELPMENDYYITFMMTLSNALERIRTYLRMEDMVDQLSNMWGYDALTHVYNRGGFFRYADDLVKAAREEKQDLLFLFLDMDHLKPVNDELGHDEGDRFICAMADILKSVVKRDELLMRYGGDEFVILARGYSEERAKAYVKLIGDRMEEYNLANPKKYTLDASVGYYIVDSHVEKEVNTLIGYADQAMYMIKKEKKSRKK